MRRFVLIFAAVVSTLLVVMSYSAVAADSCGKNKTFFGLPTWYKYLQLDQNCAPVITEKITTTTKDAKGKTTTVVNDKVSLKAVWLIVLAVIEMLLGLAGIIAVGVVILGGFKFVTARGNPDNIVTARRTVINALIGVVIAVFASQIVAFLAGRLG